MVDVPDVPLIGSTLNEINRASKRRIADKAHALATSVGVGFHLNLREAKQVFQRFSRETRLKC